MSDGPQQLPCVTVASIDGEPIQTAGWIGRPLVLFCYPRASTPGCTREAQDFSALAPEFEAAGVRVVGVSRDAPRALGRFRDKAELRVELVSDESGALTEALCVWVEKKMYGRTSMGVERATFHFAADGSVARAWRKVRAAGHAEAVLAHVTG